MPRLVDLARALLAILHGAGHTSVTLYSQYQNTHTTRTYAVTLSTLSSALPPHLCQDMVANARGVPGTQL